LAKRHNGSHHRALRALLLVGSGAVQRLDAGPRHRRRGWSQPGSTTARSGLSDACRAGGEGGLTMSAQRTAATRDYRASGLSETEVAVIAAVLTAADAVLLAERQWPESELQPGVVDHAQRLLVLV
jgi:hypothetical protein